ncbi:MAG: iron ABC transporter permease [archaeon]|nr:iron ABC transporter permease [archaeon]
MASENSRRYRRKNRMRVMAMAVAAVIVFVIAVYSLSVSSFQMGFEEAWGMVYRYFLGIAPEGYREVLIEKIIFQYNVPRTIAGVFVGIILAVSGAVMQTVTRNPLAEPYTIGISSAALFGVSIALVYGWCIVPGLDHDMGMVVNAFLFAMLPCAAIVFISSFKKMSPTMMVLVGIGMMYMFSAFTTFIKFNASDEKLEEIYRWSIGTLSDVKMDDLLPLAIACIIVVLGLMFLAKKINVLMSGDKVCQSLGVRPTRIRIYCFVLVSIGVATSVCYSGTIGFVGLVAPHLARLFTGSDNKLLIPASGILGALMVLGGDVIVRLLTGGLPVGVITALIGSPLFLFFLYRQRKSAF